VGCQNREAHVLLRRTGTWGSTSGAKNDPIIRGWRLWVVIGFCGRKTVDPVQTQEMWGWSKGKVDHIWKKVCARSNKQQRVQKVCTSGSTRSVPSPSVALDWGNQHADAHQITAARGGREKTRTFSSSCRSMTVAEEWTDQTILSEVSKSTMGMGWQERLKAHLPPVRRKVRCSQSGRKHGSERGI